MDTRLGPAGRFVEAAIPLEFILDLDTEIGSGFGLNVAQEEGNIEPDNGNFLSRGPLGTSRSG